MEEERFDSDTYIMNMTRFCSYRGPRGKTCKTRKININGVCKKHRDFIPVYENIEKSVMGITKIGDNTVYEDDLSNIVMYEDKPFKYEEEEPTFPRITLPELSEPYKVESTPLLANYNDIPEYKPNFRPMLPSKKFINEEDNKEYEVPPTEQEYEESSINQKILITCCVKPLYYKLNDFVEEKLVNMGKTNMKGYGQAIRSNAGINICFDQAVVDFCADMGISLHNLKSYHLLLIHQAVVLSSFALSK